MLNSKEPSFVSVPQGIGYAPHARGDYERKVRNEEIKTELLAKQLQTLQE